MGRISVEITGDFLVDSSLARVNRGLFGALAARDEIDLGVLGEPAGVRIEGTDADALLQARRLTRFLPNPDVTIRHRWPPVFQRIASGKYVHVQPWEFGSLPKAWAEELPRVADEVWCYSRYVADMYVRAGFSPERVAVVRLGFDPGIYSPGPAPATVKLGDRCVFLYVGDTIERKGIDVAIEAYVKAFKPSDAVVFIVKDFGKKFPGTDTRLRDRVVALSQRTDVPPIVYIENTYTDQALANLYRAATALVSPYRGEGFGLPVLEALACGTTALVTRGGATDDFTSETSCYLIDAKTVRLGRSHGGFELVDDAFWLEPSEESLIEAMREVYARPDVARARGERGEELAHSAWTWAHGAAEAADRLQALMNSAPLVPARPAPDARDLNRFELRIASPGGEDGVLLELFRRLGVVEPFFVESVLAGEQASLTAFLAQSLAWRGIVIPSGMLAGADFERTLSENGVPVEFELLALAPGGREFESLSTFRPKVVVARLGGEAPPIEFARSRGYVPIGVESNRTSALFVREDLASRARFPIVG